LFGAFIFLALVAPSLTVGPFSWLPLISLSNIADAPIGLGPLSLVPGAMVLAWLVARLLETPRRHWLWGRLGVSIPLAGLTLLMLSGLEPALDQRTLVVLITLVLLWSVYLFVVNEKPDLTLSLGLVVAIQGSVALGQFVCQRDLGISLLGEPTLDREVSGVSVLWARGSRWLRAYGLTGNPNVLGAVLSVLLLILADDIIRARGWRQLFFTFVASSGLLGLLTTFSRSSWLAFGLGLLAWALRRSLLDRLRTRSKERRPLLLRPQVVVPIILAALFLLLHDDLVASRFLHLETPIEARSIRDRRLDTDLAIRLVKEHPWRGVGVSNYLVAVRAIETDSRTVHNTLLLIAAELGLPGAALWLWLALSSLLHPLSAGWVPWVAMLVSTLFDISLSMTNSWYATVVFALLAAHASLPLGTASAAGAGTRVRPRRNLPETVHPHDQPSPPTVIGPRRGRSDSRNGL
jgi:O-antigen ligase